MGQHAGASMYGSPRARGQGLVEYALVVGMISLLAIAALTVLGGGLGPSIAAALTTVATSVSAP